MPRNSSAGMVTLIQLMRLSSTPRNNMANTGAVMVRVVRKIASMPGRTLVSVVRGLMISHTAQWRLIDRYRGQAPSHMLPAFILRECDQQVGGAVRRFDLPPM